MAKPEWGIKRVCQSCATKFYDLGRSPIAYPTALLVSYHSHQRGQPHGLVGAGEDA